MQVTQKQLEAFPPKSNPFHHDAIHCGQSFGSNHMLMWSQDSDMPLKYFIVIDTNTGKRIKFTVEPDEDAETAREETARILAANDARLSARETARASAREETALDDARVELMQERFPLYTAVNSDRQHLIDSAKKIEAAEAAAKDEDADDVAELRADLVQLAFEVEPIEPEAADIAELRFDLEGHYPALEKEPEGEPTS